MERVEDISVVIVDYNNIPLDVAKILHTDQSRNLRLGSARSSVRGSFLANLDYQSIAVPSQLKIHQEILQLICQHETEAVKEMFKKLGLREVVGIRGLNLVLEEGIMGENGPVETLMWNPLHFAVYFQNQELVAYMVKEMKINLGLTGQKHNAESEKEAVNTDRYKEDKLLSLLLAYDRKDPDILKILLDEGFRIWPSKCLNTLLGERLNTDANDVCPQATSFFTPLYAKMI